jgi:hypothetical protein
MEGVNDGNQNQNNSEQTVDQPMYTGDQVNESNQNP